MRMKKTKMVGISSKRAFLQKKSRSQARSGRSDLSPEVQIAGTVTVRLPNGPAYVLTPGPGFQRTAVYWQYVLRNRIRWLRDGKVPESVLEQSVKDLHAIGFDEDKLAQIAAAGGVEIGIPYSTESQLWDLRIFPWEFVLDNATSEKRRGAPLVVIRHISSGDQSVPPDVPKKLMVVESAPGALGDIFDFGSERRLVQANLQLGKTHCSVNPTAEELEKTIARERPDVIHVAGVDSHQGKQLLDMKEGEPEPGRQEGVSQRVRARLEWDGYMMAKSDGSPVSVSAPQLARLLGAEGKRRAQLVVFNFYNSAARLAAMAAAEAALAAIGFQDEVDDRSAEEFFAKFYFAWRTLDWNLLDAFRVALSETKLEGAVVVLWSTRSLLEGVKQQPLLAVQKRVAAARRTAPGRDLSKLDPEDVLAIEIELKPTLNYSLLHNDADLFEQFSIFKLIDGPIGGVCVEITLFAGSESSQWAETFAPEDTVTNLSGRIRFALTSPLMRSIRESLSTLITIRVTWNSKVLRHTTERVNLMAIDEWVDTIELDAYLPSFVFPRDPAVSKIIDLAQRYLMVLNDDSDAGFDGYQGVDPQAKDPVATVDLQAQAIWSALIYDMRMSYINPPPTFTQSSQRLRTPSDVVNGRRGTCIDLALLLAACFEYVGIYPIIFLLEGHAFPGYWRSEENRDAFIEMDREAGRGRTGLQPLDTGNLLAPLKPWCFNNHREVFELARQGSIVPLESVWLTERRGFWDAVDEGMNDLRSKGEFAVMIDVQGARTSQVTPLPILKAQP